MENLKISNLSKAHKRNTTWSREARVQAVSQYLVLGNMSLVSAITKIPHQLLRAWKRTPWWKELEAEIRASQNLELDNKLTKIVDRSLEAVADRLERGDFVYNAKTGQMVRKPVGMKDAAKVSVDLLAKRELLRGNATERKETTQISVGEQLKQLAVEFAKWQNPQKLVDVNSTYIPEGEVEDAIYEERAEGLQEGTGLGTQDPSNESCGTGGEELGSGDDGEGWESSQGGWQPS
jgi:transposase-like protein